jgi:phage-related protein
MGWSLVFATEEARKELDALSSDMRASLERIAQLIQIVGLERVHQPHIKHLEGPLWEMRLRGRNGIARAIYMTASGQRVMILRVFVKKSQKTPHSEIELALKRAKETS